MTAAIFGDFLLPWLTEYLVEEDVEGALLFQGARRIHELRMEAAGMRNAIAPVRRGGEQIASPQKRIFLAEGGPGAFEVVKIISSPSAIGQIGEKRASIPQFCVVSCKLVSSYCHNCFVLLTQMLRPSLRALSMNSSVI